MTYDEQKLINTVDKLGRMIELLNRKIDLLSKQVRILPAGWRWATESEVEDYTSDTSSLPDVLIYGNGDIAVPSDS